ncbi:PREDICTED: uncharacterized protein LOC104808475 [Tarenaya hassleriana]|uniref:uncharacterized protein LOC104808475 n=1 Tax=Tarenaya hassleriana TaxID=28532 RepID=UPI00053C81E2|nr:PREDICTED: uncharacterized protein LOC104808475 [Tarenaya hassleriana]
MRIYIRNMIRDIFLSTQKGKYDILIIYRPQVCGLDRQPSLFQVCGLEMANGVVELSRSVPMSSLSPAHSWVSTTAVTGGGGSNGAAAGLEDFRFPPDIASIQERKDEAMHVLKANLMAGLDRQVKSLEGDNWIFEGPRSRINLISRRGGHMQKQAETAKNSGLA